MFWWVWRNDAQCELNIMSFSLIGLLVVGSEWFLSAAFWGILIGSISSPFLILYAFYRFTSWMCSTTYVKTQTLAFRPFNGVYHILLIGNHDAGTSTLFETCKLFPNDHNLNVLLTE
eukprot:857191_1